MGSPFIYLTIRSIWNRVRARIARLRQPRYLFGTIGGAAYFYWFLIRRPPGSRSTGANLLGLLTPFHDEVVLAAALLLFVAIALVWVLPGGRPAITFTKGEVQFLVTAPVSRRDILRYKVLRSQLPLFFSAALTTAFLRPGSFSRAWTFFAGMFLTTTALRLHWTGVKLRRQSLAEHGAGGWQASLVPLVIVLGTAAVLVATVTWHWDAIATASVRGQLRQVLLPLSSTGAAGWVLWPFRALARVPLSRSPAEFARQVPFVISVIVALYLWIIRSDATFEEASPGAANAAVTPGQRSRPAAPATRARRTPFRLLPGGRIETAIVWKNLIRLNRYASPAVFLRITVLLIFGLMFALRSGGGLVSGAASSFAFFATGFSILMGPQVIRNDLRQDLGHLTTLKTWPISGAALVRAEIAAPALILTAIAWMAILVAGVAVPAPRLAAAPAAVAASRLGAILAAMALAPGLIAVQLTIHNAMALLFPAWAGLYSNRARGLDVMGQRMFFLAGLLLTLLIALLPAAIAAAVAGGALYAVTRTVPLVVPAAVALVVLLGECAVASHFLGRAFERTDPSAVEATE